MKIFGSSPLSIMDMSAEDGAIRLGISIAIIAVVFCVGKLVSSYCSRRNFSATDLTTTSYTDYQALGRSEITRNYRLDSESMPPTTLPTHRNLLDDYTH